MALQVKIENLKSIVRPDHAFTLIELMVVITIIVVLLALLAPALDRAVYQAELAVCGANLHAVGSGAITYAMDYRRSYPHRPAVHDSNIHDVRPIHLTYSPMWGQRGNHQASGYDDRPTYRPYFPLTALMCPLTDRVDLESPKAFDTTIFVNYPMWFGWQYRINDETAPGTGIGTSSSATGRGMLRLGDQLEVGGKRFNVLAGDLLMHFGFNTVASSHPDAKNILPLVTADSQDRGAFGKVTDSVYIDGASSALGVFDPAYVRDDGSVQRYENVYYNARKGYGWPRGFQDDPRLSRVPSGTNVGGGMVVPRGQ